MIPGLSIQNDFLSEPQCAALVEFLRNQLDSLPCSTDGSSGRTRILRYGFDYDPPYAHLRDIPAELKLVQSNAVTINEYPPRHGIAPHFDSEAFGEEICILSLNAIAVMNFSRRAPWGFEQFTLHPGSLLRMSGEARHRWKHAVPVILPGKTRYSVVFRTLKK